VNGSPFTVSHERKKRRLIPEEEKACSICRDGPSSALIRSALLVAIGCGHPTPMENSAAIAALRSATFRLRLGHACGCVPARLAVTVRRVVRPDDTGNRRERPSGALAPTESGRAVPANSFLKQHMALFTSSDFGRGCCSSPLQRRGFAVDHEENPRV